jgi:prolyl oligopeptidase
VETGRDLQDTIRFVKFSDISWTKDNRGFFYSGYGEAVSGDALTSLNRNQRVYYHRLGTPQSADEIIYENRDQPDWLYGAKVSDDGVYAIITIYEGTDPRTRLYYVYLGNPTRPRVNAPVVRLIDRFDAVYEFVHSTGDYLLVRTNLGAPRGKLVRIDINNTQPDRWVTVIPETSDALQRVIVAGEHIVTSYLEDAHSTVRVYGMPQFANPQRARGMSGPGGGEPVQIGNRAPPASADRRAQTAPGYPYIGELRLPGPGTVDVISGKPGDNEMFFSFVSYLSPRTIYRHDLKRNLTTEVKAPALAVDASGYETKQVFFNSRDGTRVPMFITMKKGLVLDGSNPTILHGYGGFNIAQTPSFSPANLVWMEMGGIYAVANLRGGSEYGKEWHEAGILGKKQNVFESHSSEPTSDLPLEWGQDLVARA